MTRNEFLYADNFPDLTDAEINAAYQETSVIFSGVKKLWSVLDAETREAKRGLCLNLLTAWYLADTNPSSVTGAIANGGMTVSSKSIGGTSLTFDSMETQEGLKQLNSNMFGQKALMIIQGAPERYGIYG